MKLIDAHTHLGYWGHPFNVESDAEGLIALMDKFNVEKSFCSYFDNKIVEDAVKKYPDRIIGQVWEDPNLGQAAVDDMRHHIKDLGFKSLKLHPLINGFVANAPIVYPFMEEARSLNIPVFFHTGHPPYSLPWAVGELARDFPDVRIVMIHMGHGHAVYIQSAVELAKKLPNIYLETSGMPMHTKIKEVFDTIGEDRVMYGSDIPFHDPSVELQRMKVTGITDAQMQKLLHDNALSFC